MSLSRNLLNVFGDMRASESAALWEAARPMGEASWRPGMWLGRNGGMPWLMKWGARTLVRRDYFIKLILEGWGINVRVYQDGSWMPRPSAHVRGGVKVDLPFEVNGASLDYGTHLAGLNVGAPLGVYQLRDYMRELHFSEALEVMRRSARHHVAAHGLLEVEVDPEDDPRMLIGYIAPLGVEALKASPFAMAWLRDAMGHEIESAEVYLASRRLMDTTAQVQR